MSNNQEKKQREVEIRGLDLVIVGTLLYLLVKQNRNTHVSYHYHI